MSNNFLGSTVSNSDLATETTLSKINDQLETGIVSVPSGTQNVQTDGLTDQVQVAINSSDIIGSLPVTLSAAAAVIITDVDMNTSQTENLNVNLASYNFATDIGAADNITQRVVIASDQPAISTKMPDDEFQNNATYTTSLEAKFGTSFDGRFVVSVLSGTTAGFIDHQNEYTSITSNGVNTGYHISSIQPVSVGMHSVTQIHITSQVYVDTHATAQSWIGLVDDVIDLTPQNAILIGRQDGSTNGYDIRIIRAGDILEFGEGDFTHGSQFGDRNRWNSMIIRFSNIGVSPIEFYSQSIITGKYELVHRWIAQDMAFDSPLYEWFFTAYTYTNDAAATAGLDISRLKIENNAVIEQPTTITTKSIGPLNVSESWNEGTLPDSWLIVGTGGYSGPGGTDSVQFEDQDYVRIYGASIASGTNRQLIYNRPIVMADHDRLILESDHYMVRGGVNASKRVFLGFDINPHANTGGTNSDGIFGWFARGDDAVNSIVHRRDNTELVYNEDMSGDFPTDFGFTTNTDRNKYRIEIIRGDTDSTVMFYDRIDSAIEINWHLIHTLTTDIFHFHPIWYLFMRNQNSGAGAETTMYCYDLSLRSDEIESTLGKKSIAQSQSITIASDEAFRIQSNQLDEIIVSALSPDFQSNFRHNINDRLWKSYSTNPGTVVYITSGEARVRSLADASANVAVLTSIIPLHYRNGQESVCRITVVNQSAYDGTTQLGWAAWGLFDRSDATASIPLNAIVFGYSTTDGLFCGIRDNSTTFNRHLAKQNDGEWNGDKLAMTFDSETYNFFEIRYIYLGTIGIEWCIYDSILRKMVIVHRYTHGNISTVPFITNPILCVGGESQQGAVASTGSTAAAQLRIHSCMIGTMGRNNPRLLRRAIRTDLSALTNGTDYLVLRCRDQYEGINNHFRFFLKSFNALVSNSGSARSAVQIFSQTVWSVARTGFTDLDTNNSIIEQSTTNDGTISDDGILVYSIDFISDGSHSIENLRDVYCEPNNTLMFRIFNTSGTTTVSQNLLVEEDI